MINSSHKINKGDQKMFDKNQIIKLRNGHELTQLDFARKIGTSRVTVGKWESGDGKPSLDLLVKISEAFHVPVSFFFNGE